MSMRAVGRPGFHALFKSTGDDLLCDWAARNTGASSGNVFLRLVNNTQDNAIVAMGPLVSVLPGQQAPLVVDIFGLVGGNQVEPGMNNMRVDMLLQRPEGNLFISGHSFTLDFTV